MIENNTKKSIAFYSCAHFCVDFFCIFLLTQIRHGAFGATELYWWEYALVYNFCAFALQLPIGMVLDRMKNVPKVTALGCIFIALGWVVPAPVMVRVVLIGVGNAMFHAGGGTQILRKNQSGKATAIGVFVSTGAMGVFLGPKFSWAYGWIWAAVVMLVLASFMMCEQTFAWKMPERPESKKALGAMTIAIVCLSFTVLIRAVVGGALAWSWSLPGAVAFSGCVVLGKALGGVAGDRFGIRRWSAISLGVAAVLFVVAFQWQGAAFGAVLLFNMTMPLTVMALCSVLPNSPGTAFGLTTMALFLGTLPSLGGWNRVFFQPGMLAGACVLSAVLIWVGILMIKAKAKEQIARR